MALSISLSLSAEQNRTEERTEESRAVESRETANEKAVRATRCRFSPSLSTLILLSLSLLVAVPEAVRFRAAPLTYHVTGRQPIDAR